MKARAGKKGETKKGETEDVGGKKRKVAKAEKEDAIEPEKLTEADASRRRARKAQDLHAEKGKPKEEPEEVGKEVRKRKRESTKETLEKTDVKTKTKASNKEAAKKPEDKEEKDGREPSKRGSRKCDDKRFQKDPKEVEACEKKARQSRKSSAYHVAKKAALKRGCTMEEALEEGRAATQLEYVCL